MQADTEKKWSSALVETFAKSPFGQSAEKGAISLEYACTSPDMDGAAVTLIKALRKLAWQSVERVSLPLMCSGCICHSCALRGRLLGFSMGTYNLL